MKHRFAICLILTSFVAYTRGAVVFSDDFSYGDGGLVTVSGGTWVHHSGSTTGELDVVSSRAFVTSAESEDLNAQLQSAPYTIASGVYLYASFTVNFSSLPTGTGTYFAHFKDSTTSGFRARVFATTNGAPSNAFRLGIGNAGATANATLTNNLSLNNNFTVVIRYIISNATSTIWLNPSNETDQSATASDSTSALDIYSFALRQGTGGTSSDKYGSLYFDNLLVGTTFSDVVSGGGSTNPPSIISQPVSLTVTQGDNASFSILASGTAPLRYQWRFNGSNLSGETNSDLSFSSVTATQAGTYDVIVTNSFGTTNSDPVTLSVYVPQVLFSLLTYNMKGNGATNWSTNSTQVQAIARVVQYLDPDIITFNETPFDLRYEMTNFVAAFLPGYSVAISTGTDGFICSTIASRYPILLSRKWLDSAQLEPWGYTNSNFTRDLFEAQVNVPGLAKPVHVFTTHLKSSGSGYADAANKRAAEAAAITNFFATNFFTFYSNDLYTLSGDMNEDNTNTLAIKRLVSTPMALQMINPINPVTGSGDTFNSTNPSSRFDYIFPCPVLASNVNSKQVFRADKITPTPPLTTNDTRIASDHLPVLMVFNNPFASTNQPYTNPVYSILSFSVNNQQGTFKWQSLANRTYNIERSADLTNWSIFRSNLVASGTNFTITTNIPFGSNFFRIYRVP